MIQWSTPPGRPNLVRVYPQDIARMTLQIWQHKDMLLGQLSHLPQVLCHLDFFCLNLIVRQRSGSNETVALDWAFTGQGALGEDLVPLILASLMFGGMGLDQAADLEGEVWPDTFQACARAGWKGDEHLVWEGYAAAGALRYGPSALRMVPLEALMAGILKLDGVTPFEITVQEWVNARCWCNTPSPAVWRRQPCREWHNHHLDMEVEMARILFITWDGGGNQPPAIGMAQELKRRGHTVIFAVNESHARISKSEVSFSFASIHAQTGWICPLNNAWGAASAWSGPIPITCRPSLPW